MRQYRGKRKDNNEWVYGWYAEEPEDGAVILVNSDEPLHDCKYCLIEVEVIPSTVGQQVGLKDRNGKEIYEGDIMEYYSACVPKGTNPIKRNVVRWNQRGCRFDGCFSGEIIGTIHDTPEGKE